MNKDYDTCTKEKDLVSYDLFIEKSLIQLGFINSHWGTFYFKKIILLAFYKNINNILIYNLYTELSKQFDKMSQKKICDNIKNAFRRMNRKKAEENFEKIFKIPYDEYFLTPKNLIFLFINALNRLSL